MRELERLESVCKGRCETVQMRVKHCATAVRGEETPVAAKDGSEVESTAGYDGCRCGGYVVWTCGDRGWTRGENGVCDAGGQTGQQWGIDGRFKCVVRVARHLGFERGQEGMERWVNAAVTTGGKGGDPHVRRAVSHAGRHRFVMLVAARNNGAFQVGTTCGERGARTVAASTVESVCPNVGQRVRRGWQDAGTAGLKTCGSCGGASRVIPVQRDVAVRRSVRVQSARGYTMHSRGKPAWATQGTRRSSSREDPRVRRLVSQAGNSACDGGLADVSQHAGIPVASRVDSTDDNRVEFPA